MADIQLAVTASEIDAAVAAYSNFSIAAARIDVDSDAFTDTSMDDSQKVAAVVDADHVILGVVEDAVADLQDEIVLKTSGVITDPTFLDNGNGTATIGNCTVNLYATNDFTGHLAQYDVTGNTFTITDGAEEYICVSYNSGVPIMYLENTKTDINNSSVILLMVVWRQGNVVHSISTDSYGLGLPEKMASRCRNTEPYRLSVDGGLVISETTSPTARTIIVTPAVVYAGVTPQSVLSYNSSTDLLTKFIETNGVHTYDSTSHVYDSTKYNPTTGEASLPSNKYKTIWFYRSIGNVKEVFYRNGTGYYTSTSEALLEAEPNKPLLIRDHCLLIGRIIFKEGGTSGVQTVIDINKYVSNTVPINSITGSGTTNKLAKFTDTNVVGDSIISELGTEISIAGTLTYTGKLTQRIIVGTKGHFTTIKAAVDWFNANSTTNTEILIDAGDHLVVDTITVNDSTHELQIRGLGSNVTKVKAATGLINKPMFVFKTPCSINKVSLIGSTLTNYGNSTGENAINFDTLNGMYSEITDIVIDTFNIGIYDTIGSSIFLFNFWLKNCKVAGYRANTAGSGLYFDCEVGSFYNNAISIDLLKANTGGFLIDTLTFDNVGSQTAIKYTGGTGNFINAGVCQITGCSYNFTGTFISGFDFTLANGRDANIIVLYNTGTENKNPHAKVNCLNNASTTTITSPGTFYKAVYTNTSSYTCKWTIANNRVTYQPANPRDVMMWVSCNVISTQLNRNIDIAIVKNGNTALGLFGQMTVRVTASNVPFAISTPVYLSDVATNDYFEIWVTNSGTGDVVLQDVSWLIDSK